MRTGIGIDTGGTYTDAVIFDFESKAILGTAKALTTKEDLSYGILEALDALPKELIASAEIVSLSTTLATNACVEDRGGRAKLIFFGGNKKTIERSGAEFGLPPVKDIYIQKSYTKFSGDIEREPDWDLFNSALDKEFCDIEGAGIIEIYSMRNSAVVEKKAKELFQAKHKIPVVCGFELTSELNCLQRGASVLLNARLFPVIREFIHAIKTAMQRRGIDADTVIVRSDGSLMSEKIAYVRPVETLLCGPAASVIGGAFLTEEKNSVVVDMGGTTTDIALIADGLPHMVVNGVSIGKWKTFVDGLYIKTLGLGGDTAIHYNGFKAFLEDYRVVPLCVAAAKYPAVIDNLKRLAGSVKKHTKYLHEHYILARDIRDIREKAGYTDDEKTFCAALEGGPMLIREAAASVPGKDIYTLDISRLLRDGVVQTCGLTPTDIMHIKGDFSRFPAEASVWGARFVASNLNISVEELCDRVYDEIRRKLYVNIVKALLENKDSFYMKNGVSKEVERFISESYDVAKTGVKHELVSMAFDTGVTLVGVGAPVHVFIHDVARLLGTKAVIPKHYEVANAIGAIVGNVFASNSVEIKPNFDNEELSGYTVFGNTKTRTFKEIKDAEEFAVLEAKNGAYAEAVRRGAQGEITVTCDLDIHEAEARDSIVYLYTYAIGRAVGTMGRGAR